MAVLGVNAARVSTTTCSNNTAERQYLVKHPHPETKGKDTSTVNIDDETIGTINDTEAKTGNQKLAAPSNSQKDPLWMSRNVHMGSQEAAG